MINETWTLGKGNTVSFLLYLCFSKADFGPCHI